MRPLRAVWVCLLALIASTSAAAAHPLGNFTINHLAKITVHGGTLHVRYILDIAEIPTFQIMQAHGGAWTGATLQSWARAEVPLVRDGFHLTIDGSPAALESSGPRAMLRPGAGGLPILRWVDDLTVPVSAGAHSITAIDRVYADRRIGWKDLIAGNQTEPTNECGSIPACSSERRAASGASRSPFAAIRLAASLHPRTNLRLFPRGRVGFALHCSPICFRARSKHRCSF